MIRFINHDRQFNLPQKRKLKLVLEKLFKKEKKTLGDIQYIFCSDDYLLEINRQYLQHDYYTDIITFDLAGENGINADIYISLDRVKDNANHFGETYRREAARVIFHGALHLCGYRDKRKSEITLMRDKENQYLSFFEKEICSR